jgi:hypothetical protein
VLGVDAASNISSCCAGSAPYRAFCSLEKKHPKFQTPVVKKSFARGRICPRSAVCHMELGLSHDESEVQARLLDDHRSLDRAAGSL